MMGRNLINLPTGERPDVLVNAREPPFLPRFNQETGWNWECGNKPAADALEHSPVMNHPFRNRKPWALCEKEKNFGKGAQQETLELR